MRLTSWLSAAAFLLLVAAGPTLAIPLDGVTWGGSTYYLLGPSLTWAESEDAAIALGGHLVSINSLEEQQFIWSRWSGSLPLEFRAMWIGLTDRDEEGIFTWTSGDPLTYTNWASGEPNSGFGGWDEDYVLMGSIWGITPEGAWNDTGGTDGDRFYAVAEAPVPEPSTALLLGVGALALGAARRRMSR